MRIEFNNNNNNYSLIKDGHAIASTSDDVPWKLDSKQIENLLPINESDTFDIETIEIRNKNIEHPIVIVKKI